MLFLYILWDDWSIFMISGSNKQLKQEFEYILLKPDCHKNAIWTWGRTMCNKILFLTWKKCHAMKAGSTAMNQRPRHRVPSGTILALPDPRRPNRANPHTNFWWSLFLTALAWSICPGFPLDRQSPRNIMLRF